MSNTQELTTLNTFDFFNLPRELRDLIYHHLFLSTPHIIQCFGIERMYLSLVYRPFFTPTDLTIPFYHPTRSSPTWLLTNKTLLYEARAQFMRHAEWYFDSGEVQIRNWSSMLRMNLRRVKRMQLYVSSLSHWETPAIYQGMNARNPLGRLADAMREEGLRFNIVRLVGHSHALHEKDWECRGQANNMVKNLMAVFHGIEVGKWEFGIRNLYGKNVWVLFDWVVGEGEDRLVVRETGEACIEGAKAGGEVVHTGEDEYRGEGLTVD
jgi:hypothetical protein